MKVFLSMVLLIFGLLTTGYAEDYKGRLTGVYKGEVYDVAVACHDYGKPEFSFNTDEYSDEDSNRDGVLIFGTTENGKMFLSFGIEGREGYVVTDNIEKIGNKLEYVSNKDKLQIEVDCYGGSKGLVADVQ